jgi:hypothetical protein
MLVPAPLALEPGEAAGEEAAPQKPLELLLYEAGQPGAVTHPRRAQTERLQMVADDLIQDALRRRSRLVAERRAGHADPIARPMPHSRTHNRAGNQGSGRRARCRFRTRPIRRPSHVLQSPRLQCRNSSSAQRSRVHVVKSETIAMAEAGPSPVATHVAQMHRDGAERNRQQRR